MATFSFIIPDGDVQRVIESLCCGLNLSLIVPPTVDADGNPDVSPLAARGTLINIVKQVVVTSETRTAQASIVPPNLI